MGQSHEHYTVHSLWKTGFDVGRTRWLVGHENGVACVQRRVVHMRAFVGRIMISRNFARFDDNFVAELSRAF